MATYATAAGLIPAPAAFFPATHLNQTIFFQFTGIYIQIVRCVCAITITTALWFYFRKVRARIFPGIKEAVVFHEWVVVLGLALTIFCGWYGADFLLRKDIGKLSARHEIIASQAQSIVDAAANTANELIKTMSGSPVLMHFEEGDSHSVAAVNSVLDRYSLVIPESICYFLLPDGVTVASSNRNSLSSFVGNSYKIRPYFQEAIKGNPSRYIAVGLTSKLPGYYTSSPVRSPDGRILGVVVIKINIGQFVSDDKEDPVFLVDKQGVILASNQPKHFLTPLWPLGEKERHDLVASGRYPRINERPLLTEQPSSGAIRTMDGAERLVISKKAAIEDLAIMLLVELQEVNKERLPAIFMALLFILLILTFFTIQERGRQTNEILRYSERSLRRTFDHVYDAIIVLDEGGCVMEVNHRMLKMYGIDRYAANGQCFLTDLSDPGCPVEEFMNIWRQVLAGEDHLFEWRARRPPDSSVFDVEVFLTALEFFGETKIVATVHNITDRKRHEQELRSAKESAEAASRAKGEFVANMSHELRTPLNAVIGFAQLLGQSDLQAQQQQYLDHIVTSGETLLSVINEILDFSKIEAGMMEIEHIAFSFRESVDAVVRLIEVPARQKGLTITKFFDPAIPEILLGDPVRVRQIFMNLLNNAIKFTNKGGITIKIRNINEHDALVTLLIEVADTGIGIPADRFSDLFHPFSQLDSSTTRRYGGTGLGLAIVHRLITSMEGEIGVESKVEVGTTFRFTIPFIRPAEEAWLETQPERQEEKTSSLLEPPQRSLKVLVAEDNLLNQEVIKNMLEVLGHTAHIAGNGEEALKALCRERFDLVFMDCQMPVMDGYEATRRIRSPASGVLCPDVPIIALTGFALRGDREQCLQAGMTEYLAKPIEMASLLEVLNRYAAGCPAEDT